MLRCIRCGACMNHCPVYQAVGGHAYGWVYPGPMGAVLTPTLIGVDEGGHLPNASTFCGRCEAVCPVRIPLPKMMRHWREREFERHLSPAPLRYGLGFWAFFAKRPALYRLATDIAARALASGRAAARAASPGCRSPAAGRDIAISPRPKAATFQSQWRARSGAVKMSARDGDLRQHPPLARRHGRRKRRAGSRSRTRLARAPAGVVPKRGPGRRRDAGRDLQGRGRARRRPRSPRSRRSPTFPRRSRDICARTTAGDVAHGRRRAPRGDAVERGRRSKSCAGPRTATISTPCRSPSPAIAETGTLALVSGADNPTTLNFLPDNQVVVRRGATTSSATTRACSPSCAQPTAGRRAAHGQFHHRPVALGRHRADAAPRRARAAAAAHRDRGVSARCGLGERRRRKKAVVRI